MATSQERRWWTEEEDRILRQEAEIQQCAKRWRHALDPDVNHSPWTEGEDRKLIEAVKKDGHNWSKICSTVFPDRSTTDIKNRYVILNRRQRGLSQDRTSPFTTDNATDNDNSSELDCSEEPDPQPRQQDSDPDDTHLHETLANDMIMTPDLPPISSQSEGNDTNLTSSVEFLTAASSLDGNNNNNHNHNPNNNNHHHHQESTMFWAPSLLATTTAETIDKNALVSEEMDPNAVTGGTGTYPMADDDASILPPNSELADTTTSSLSTSTLILEEVQPDTVNLVLNTLLTNNTRFRMRLYNPGPV
ncbi:hypothetical protein VTN96DRAFT_3146 [Rasamsonia emersonii]